MTINSSTCSHPDVFHLMTNPEGALRSSHDPSFETAWNNAHDDVPISALKGSLKEGPAPKFSGVATVLHDEVFVKCKSRHIESHRTNDKYMAREVESAVKQMATN